MRCSTLGRTAALLVAATLVALLAGGRAGAEAGKKIAILKSWEGTVKDNTLHKESPATGYLTGEKKFEKLWKAWRPEEKVPEVNFEKELVLVAVTDGPNTIDLTPQLDDKGNLTVVTRATLKGGDGFSYRIVTVARAGIVTVKGKPLVLD